MHPKLVSMAVSHHLPHTHALAHSSVVAVVVLLFFLALLLRFVYFRDPLGVSEGTHSGAVCWSVTRHRCRLQWLFLQSAHMRLNADLTVHPPRAIQHNTKHKSHQSRSHVPGVRIHETYMVVVPVLASLSADPSRASAWRGP